MKYLTIDLYQDFVCSEDTCPNTCRTVSIDAGTHKKMTGKQDSRYPRIVSAYGSVMEENLAVSCPEVISMLMEKDSIRYDFGEDDTAAPIYMYAKLYLYESAARNRIIDMMQYDIDITLSARLFAVYAILEKAVTLYQQKMPDTGTLKEVTEESFLKKILYSVDERLHSAVKESSRYKFIRQMQNMVTDIAIDGRFTKILKQSEEYFNRNDLERYLTDMQNFKNCIAEYKNFYVNYWICRMFSELIAIPDYEKVKENLMYTAAEFCLYQTLAMVSFAENGKLDREEYIFIISGVCRMAGREKKVRERLFALLTAADALNDAGLLFMIIAP